MAERLKIPIELLELNPGLTKNEIRSMIMVILKSKNNIMRQSHIFKLRLPHIGTLRSHACKKPKHRKNTLKRDKKRKREKYRKEELTPQKLLF